MKVLTNFREYVIYHGEACDVNGIHYLNVEEYLKNLT